jgi:hypothetical protein
MNEFLATILGALISLLGVLIVLHVNQNNFMTNLKEEREKVREERTFTAKHKAIMSAVESITHFLNYYITLADRDIPRGGTIPIEVSKMGVSLNRLHFYCDIETIRQSIKMSEILIKSFSRALKAKIPSMFMGEEIKAVDVRIASLESMNDHLQQEIIALLGADPLSPLLVSHRLQIAANFKTIAEFYSKKSLLIKEMYQSIEDCRNVITQDLKDVYEEICIVLLMARRELEFPIDEEEYSVILTRSTDSSLSQIKSIIDDIRMEVNKKLEESTNRK